MARAENIETFSATAGAVVRIYRFVQLQSDGKFDEVGAAQGRADGVSAEAAAADGDIFAVCGLKPGSIMKVTLGATVTPGTVVASDNQGRAIASVDSGGNYAHGVVLVGGDAGEVGEILLGGTWERDA